VDILLLSVALSLYVALRIGHSYLLIFTAAFEPKDNDLLEKLKKNNVNITKASSIWRGIYGFHLSHSLGMITYGLFFGVIVLENYSYLKSSVLLNILLFVVPFIYIFLARRFWFYAPRNCFIISVIFLLLSVALR